MATQEPSTALKATLQEDTGKKALAQLRSDVSELFQTLSDRALADAVIERLQRYAGDAIAEAVKEDSKLANSDLVASLKKVVRNELSRYLSRFITDEHRKFIVRSHARGLPTSAAVWELMLENQTINRLAQADAMGGRELKECLILLMAYLKPGTARWPEKKYGAEWHEAREAHKQEMRNIPLTSKAEQVALLAKHAERIDRQLENKTHDAKDFQTLTKSLTQTMESLRKLSAVDETVPENVSGPQLVGVLERLTLALKVPEQNTDGNGSNVLPAPGDSDGENPD